MANGEQQQSAAGNREEFNGLVLTRKPGQRILFDGPVNYVEVIEIRGNKIRMGVNAPKKTNILREEVQDDRVA